jgi:hypothetical protein
MARKVEIRYVDDLDGGDTDEAVRFGIDGAQYEIDLSAETPATSETPLARYMAKGVDSGASAARRPERGGGTEVGDDPSDRKHAEPGYPRVGESERSHGQRPRPEPGSVVERYNAG